MLAKFLLSPLIIISLLALTPPLNGKINQTSSLASKSTALTYHGGRLLTEPRGINVYIIWYGTFPAEDRTSITNFFSSFTHKEQEPTVLTWWRTTSSYKDKASDPVSGTVKLVKQVGDVYSLGKNVKRGEIGNLVIDNIKLNKLPLDFDGIYLVLTAKDVLVEKFCTSSCGFHDILDWLTRKLVYAHVGDSSQCGGLCAWPFAVPAYGPPGQAALVAPNGVAADGMVINIATLLTGAAANPYMNGYYQGDALAPLEAVTACPGIFGAGAYPGYPGNLMLDNVTKASYNVYGAGGKKFLLPAIWNFTSSNCKVVA